MNVKVKATIVDSNGLSRTLTRLAHEIIEKNKGTEGLVIIGLRTRGDFIARRIALKIQEIEDVELPEGPSLESHLLLVDTRRAVLARGDVESHPAPCRRRQLLDLLEDTR